MTCQRLHSVWSGEWRGRVAEGRTWKWRHHQPASSWIAMDWNCDQQQQFWSTLANAIIMRRSTYVPVSASRGRLGQPSLPPTMPWTWSSPNDSLLSMGAMGKEVYREFRRSSEKFGLWARNDKVNALSKLECMFVLIIWNLPLPCPEFFEKLNAAHFWKKY